MNSLEIILNLYRDGKIELTEAIKLIEDNKRITYIPYYNPTYTSPTYNLNEVTC